MESLDNKWLVDIYFEAIISKLDEPFIDMLLLEILRRKIPLVHIHDIEYALPYLERQS